MKKALPAYIVLIMYALSVAGCGIARPTEIEVSGTGLNDKTDIQVTAEQDGRAAPLEQPKPAVNTGRQNGERFEDTIILEGMEEKVTYEHIINAALGYEMDYDCALLVRCRESDRERFISTYDDPDNPENYLEVTYSTDAADTVSASISEELSKDYDIVRRPFTLEKAGGCTKIDASNAKDNGGTPDLLQTVYIIPTADGCLVVKALYSFESAETFGKRLSCIMNSLMVINRDEENRLSEEQAVSAIRSYCYTVNPELESIVNAGEYPVYWNVSSSDEYEIVVLFRSYTGAQIRYYINRITGETYATESVPPIEPEEKRTEESLNVWEYLA